MYGGEESCVQGLGGEPEVKRPLEEDTGKDGREWIRWEGADWIRLAQIRDLSGSCESGNEPSGSI